jgi:hypothetical protein
LNVAAEAAENRILRNWNRNVVDVQSDREDEEGGDGCGQLQQDIGIDDYDSDEHERDLYESGIGLSAWDQLGEGYEQDAAQISQ